MAISNAEKWLRAQWHNILLKFEASVLVGKIEFRFVVLLWRF